MRASLIALVALLAPTAAAADERLAVLLPLVSVAVDEGERAAIEQGLRARAGRFGARPLDDKSTRQVLSDVVELGFTCDYGALECLVRVGGLAAADLVVAGSVSRSGAALDLELLVVDVAAMREVARQRVPVRQGKEFEVDLDSALCAVLAPDRWRGTLRVNVKQRGASIVVDGVPRGFTPLPKPLTLRPGTHEVYVGLEGFRAHIESVVVPYAGGVEREVKLQAGVSKPPPGFQAPAVALTSVATSAEATPPPPAVERDRRRPLRVAVYDVDVAGVEPRIGRVIGQYLLQEIKKRERTSVIGADEIRALIDASTPPTSADNDPELGAGIATCSSEQCFADVAEALGADAVVVAQLTVLEGEILFGVRRIDQARQEVTGSVLERVPASEPVALLGLIGPAVDALFKDAPLRPGETAGVDEGARRRLDPPPLPPAVPFSLGGGAVVASVVGGVAGLLSLSALSDYTTLIASASGSEPTPVDAAVLASKAQQAQLGAIVGWTGAGLGIALAAAAGLTSLATNWEGDLDGAPEQP